MKTAAHVVVLACSALLLGGCATGGIQYSDKVTAVETLSPGEDIETQVLAKAEEWRNSGVQVHPGNRYRIQAEGRWRVSSIHPWTGPDGVGAGAEMGLVNPIVVGYTFSTLIAKVGESGTPFAVGNSYELAPSADGVLFFRINDVAGWCGDNEGSMKVRISLKKPSGGVGQAPVVAFIACDLRVVRVQDGSIVVSASGHASSDKLENLGKILAGKMKGGFPIKGESLAVASLHNRSGTVLGKTLADEVTDKVAGALVETAWFDIKERINLRTILAEKDLESSDIIKSSQVQEKLAGIKYIVIGGVTLTEGAR